MEELTKRIDLIVSNVDKGGAVAIMDKASYIRESNHQIFDDPRYK